MRIWSEKLIPKLCQKHLCGMWRESLGAYKIITENKIGYRNHPAVKEWENNPYGLWQILKLVKIESKKRGYNFKELPFQFFGNLKYGRIKGKEWQSLDEQIKILKLKQKTTNCKCNV